LQCRVHPGFRYEGLEDPSRFSPEKIHQSELLKRCCKVLDGFDKSLTLPMLFCAANPPENAWVSSRSSYLSTSFFVFFQIFDMILLQINDKTWHCLPPPPPEAAASGDARSNDNQNLATVLGEKAERESRSPSVAEKSRPLL